MNAISTHNWYSSIGKIDDLQIDIVHDINYLKAEWCELFEQGNAFIFQHFDWVKLALETIEVNNQSLIITARDDNQLIFILPLVLVPGSPNIIRWVGASHANLCVGIYDRSFLNALDPMCIPKTLQLIANTLPGAISLHLQNQPHEIYNFDNPVNILPYQPSSAIMHEIDLSEGFEAVLNHGNGKRKRKIFRRQERISQEMGGYSLSTLTDPDEIRQTLDVFFELKRIRFDEIGVRDVFSDQQTKDFLQALAFETKQNSNQMLRLYVLEVGGKMRALYGCGIHQNHCHACINAITYDDFSKESPGEMIVYLLVQKLKDEGITSLDFGAGDERYKRSWSTSSQQLQETIVSLTRSALVYALFDSAKSRLKSRIRNHPKLWAAAKVIRKQLANKAKQ